MDTNALYETLNAATGMGDATGLVIKAIGLCGLTLIVDFVVRVFLGR